MVTKNKRTTTSKKPAKKPEPLPRPDFEKGRELVDKLVKRNTEWLKQMSKR